MNDVIAAFGRLFCGRVIESLPIDSKQKPITP